MTILALYNRFSQLNTDKVIEESVADTKDQILRLNKEQLLAGKTRTGADITPSYLDDPYFKTREAAQKYSEWKDRITPNPFRKSGTPNLYINGFYHNSIRVDVVGQSIQYSTNVGIGSKIEGKYGENLYGLSGNFKSEYLGVYLGPLLLQKIQSLTGLNFQK